MSDVSHGCSQTASLLALTFQLHTLIVSLCLQGITDQNQLLDLTHRACTKRYILYMHKMNKRENVRAAVDLACLGLSSADPSQSGSLPQSVQSAPELPSSTLAAAPAAAARTAPVEPRLEVPAVSFVSVPHAHAQAPGAEAAALAPSAQTGTMAAAAVAAVQDSSEQQSLVAQDEPLRRSARVLITQPLTEPPSSSQAEAAQSSIAAKHDWVNPSDELLATLREELDLELRDAPDDSDGSRGGESALAKKCRPWHWLQEMRSGSQCLLGLCIGCANVSLCHPPVQHMLDCGHQSTGADIAMCSPAHYLNVLLH